MLSVIIHTKNEEKYIKGCIDSIKNLADEILVVDMLSDDKTVNIAKKASKKVKVLEYKKEHGFADPARNWAIEQTQGDWILILDADERVESELGKEIPQLMESENDVFYLPRQNMIWGEWIKHTGWWPDYQPRLFRKGHLTWPGKVHAQPEVKGQVEHLPAQQKYALLHYNYDSVEDFIERLNRYTTLAAKKKEVGKEIGVLETFFDEFLRRLFAQEGYKDGYRGQALSLLQGSYELATLLKSQHKGSIKSETADALRKFQKDLNYWLADLEVKNSQGLVKVYWQVRRKLKV
jgi:glycosyltransferase involved in cell wall biosynthesis